jgi:hypothetical protein
MTTLDKMYRVAQHEAGHATAALHYRLPLREVVINSDGTGYTAYARWRRADAEAWTVTAYSGPEAEKDLFLDGSADEAGDLLAIDSMLGRLGLDWDARRLATLRFESQILVQRLRPRIAAVASGLIEHGALSADGVRVYINTD